MSYTRDNEEKTIVYRLKKGDPKAFEALFNKYKNRLFLFAIKFVKSEDLASDMLHDVFLKIWEKRKQLDPEQSFNSYIHTICKNTIFNFLKYAAKKNSVRLEIIHSALEHSNVVENDFYFRQYEKIAHDALEQLPPRRKEVYMECKMNGKSYDETASILGISRNAVKDHMVNANKFIKSYFLLHGEISI